MLLTESDIARLRDAGHDGFFEVREGWLVLQNDPDTGACVFLGQDGRCTVHAIRPDGCRLYPLIFDEDAGPMLDREICPYTADFDAGAKDRSAVRRLRDQLVRERRLRADG